jgi:hypothetical protein
MEQWRSINTRNNEDLLIHGTMKIYQHKEQWRSSNTWNNEDLSTQGTMKLQRSGAVWKVVVIYIPCFLTSRNHTMRWLWIRSNMNISQDKITHQDTIESTVSSNETTELEAEHNLIQEWHFARQSSKILFYEMARLQKKHTY